MALTPGLEPYWVDQIARDYVPPAKQPMQREKSPPGLYWARRVRQLQKIRAAKKERHGKAQED